MDIQPLNEYLIVEVDKSAEETKGGMVIATTKGERTQAKAIKGKVIAMADDIGRENFYKYIVPRSSIDDIGNITLTTIDQLTRLLEGFKKGYKRVAIGQTVWVAKWEGQELQYNGKSYLFIKQDYILGKLPVTG